MSCKDVLGKLGEWQVKLKPDSPPGVIAGLEYFGHVAIVPGQWNAEERGDDTLTAARYVGILRDVQVAADTTATTTLSGVHVTAWLGDEDGKGDVIEYPGITLTAATFADAVRALLPASGAVTEGTIYTGITGTYSNTHNYQSPRAALDYVCDVMGGEYRVNNDCTLDAGPASSLYQTTPTAIIARADLAGYDQQVKALPGALESTRSVKDYTTRVVIVAQALGGGTADVASVPYKDMHGNDVVWTRIVDETTDTLTSNAAARAQSTLNLWSGVRRALRLNADEFDIAGDFAVGDVVWCWDPEAGIADTGYEVDFRGRLINPAAVRVRELTWPIAQGMSVAYRNGDGSWVDLTPWVAWESGRSEIVVSDSLSTSLTPGVGGILTVVPGGGSGAGDTAVPDVPVFGTFTTTSYQPGDGLAQAAIKVTWTQPLNTDASTIVDGDHYEIRYRPTATTEWQVSYVGFDQTDVTITGLSPSTTYEFQIRAVDYASPINYGAWSATTSFLSATDTTPPDPPAAPTVAASQLAVQVTHTLGLAAGGTYNLPLDMDHFEVHVGTAAGFTPSAASLAGKLLANAAMITGGIPAVGTYQVDTIVPAGDTAYVKVVAVDKTGNASAASAAASATAELVDSAHISDLTATKITAGTMSATYLLAGLFRTATSGQRVEVGTNGSSEVGVRLYDPSGTKTVDLDAATGDAYLQGVFQAGASTADHIIIDAAGTYPTIWFNDSTGTAYSFVNSPAGGLGLNTADNGSYYGRLYLTATVSELSSKAAGTQTTLGGTVIVDPNGVAIEYRAASSILRGDIAVSGSGVSARGRDSSGTELSALVVDSSGNVRLESKGGSNYAILGVPGSTYMQMSGSGGDITIYKGGASYLYFNGSNIDMSAVAAMYLYGPAIRIGQSTDLVYSPAIENNYLSTTSGNVYVTSTAGTPYARLYRANVSSRVLKVEVEDYDGIDIMALSPVAYYDRRQWVENGRSTDGIRRGVGLIAEELAVIPGADMLLDQDMVEGALPSVNYDRVVLAILPSLQDLVRRVETLEGHPVTPRRHPRAHVPESDLPPLPSAKPPSPRPRPPKRQPEEGPSNAA